MLTLCFHGKIPVSPGRGREVYISCRVTIGYSAVKMMVT